MFKILFMILLGTVSVAFAQEGRGCTNASLRGDYAFVLKGTKPSGPPPAPQEDVIGLARTRFDGYGGSTNIDNLHGTISPLSPDRPGTGTYTINADCTGTGVLFNAGSPPLQIRIVIVDKGNEVWTITTSPASVLVIGIGKKI